MIGQETRVSFEEFCSRFVAHMIRCAAPVILFDDGSSIADYAAATAPTYFDDDIFRDDGPEACAEAEMSYWGE